MEQQPRFAWTPGQRTALLALLLVFLGYLAVRYALNPTYVSDPQPDEPPRARELADRIDPNTADWETLAALPQLGEKRAKAIVEYRDRHRGFEPDGIVFRKPEDLMRLRGIGGTIVEQVSPYLIFQTTQPSTRRDHD
jgi:hypothetical protein